MNKILKELHVNFYVQFLWLLKVDFLRIQNLMQVLENFLHWPCSRKENAHLMNEMIRVKHLIEKYYPNFGFAKFAATRQ